MTPARLRRDVMVHLDHTQQRHLDEQFGPGMEPAHEAMTDPDPITALLGQIYYAAAIDRRFPPPQREASGPAPASDFLILFAVVVIGAPILWLGLDDALPALWNLARGLVS